MPAEDTEEFLEIARQMKADGVECCVVCKHWDQHGPKHGQCGKSEFIVYRGPGPRKIHSVQRFKVATEGTWWCPEFKRRVLG